MVLCCFFIVCPCLHVHFAWNKAFFSKADQATKVWTNDSLTGHSWCFKRCICNWKLGSREGGRCKYLVAVITRTVDSSQIISWIMAGLSYLLWTGATTMLSLVCLVRVPSNPNRMCLARSVSGQDRDVSCHLWGAGEHLFANIRLPLLGISWHSPVWRREMNVGLDWGQNRLLGAATFRIRKGAISFSSVAYWTSLTVVPILQFFYPFPSLTSPFI